MVAYHCNIICNLRYYKTTNRRFSYCVLQKQVKFIKCLISVAISAGFMDALTSIPIPKKPAKRKPAVKPKTTASGNIREKMSPTHSSYVTGEGMCRS